MKDRIKAVIKAKTNGKQMEFAKLLGWSPQYLNRLINDGSVGLAPIISILEQFPDIDARWLILGTGSMLPESKPNSCDPLETLSHLLDLEKYIPVMTSDEIAQLAQGKVEWEAETISRWVAQLEAKNAYLNNIIACAYARQEELAKQKD